MLINSAWILSIVISPVVNAAIINASNTDTEFVSGSFADLQGLEWLSFDITLGMSRNQVVSDVVGTIDGGGWRYASISETNSLLSSLWGGVYDGWSADNYDGAQWMETIFGVTYSSSSGSGFTQNSYFMYGEQGECYWLRSCVGEVKNIDDSLRELYTVRVSDGVYETTEIGSSVGYFQVGAGLGNMVSTSSALDSDINEYRSALLVRQSASVPEPSIIALFGIGIFGLGVTRLRKVSVKHSVTS